MTNNYCDPIAILHITCASDHDAIAWIQAALDGNAGFGWIGRLLAGADDDGLGMDKIGAFDDINERSSIRLGQDCRGGNGQGWGSLDGQSSFEEYARSQQGTGGQVNFDGCLSAFAGQPAVRFPGLVPVSECVCRHRR